MDPLYIFLKKKFLEKNNKSSSRAASGSWTQFQPKITPAVSYITILFSAGWETDETGDYNLYHFFRGIELSKIQFQGIYESNNHSSRVYYYEVVFTNLVFHTPVLTWIKNGIAQIGLQVPKVSFHKIAAD